MRNPFWCGLMLLWSSGVRAFVTPTQSSSWLSRPLMVGGPKSVVARNVVQLKMSAFEGIKGPVQSYVDLWVPLFQSAQEANLVPDFLLHWGHGLAMASVLLTMGIVGSYMGWQIRLGNGGDVNALTLGETTLEAHPKIMGGALFFFLLGGQGGLVLLSTQGQPILESPHAVTAAIGMTMLALQASLPLLFDNDKGKLPRDVHAYLGSATMIVLFAHLATGLKLGFSF